MAFEEGCQEKMPRHVAHSELASTSWHVSRHSFVQQTLPKSTWCCPHPHPLWPTPLWLPPVPKDENPVKGLKIQWYHGVSTWTTGSAGQQHETGVSEILPATGRALGHAQNKKGAILICNWDTPKTVILPQYRNVCFIPYTSNLAFRILVFPVLGYSNISGYTIAGIFRAKGWSKHCCSCGALEHSLIQVGTDNNSFWLGQHHISHPSMQSHCQTYTLGYLLLSYLIHPEDDDCQNSGTTLGMKSVFAYAYVWQTWGPRERGMDASSLKYKLLLS